MNSALRAILLSPRWTPARLFRIGEAGLWQDPSDLSTGYQDSAATTAQTASGQPTGKRLDKSGRGNHVLQATSTARPTYTVAGGIYSDVFDGTEDFLSCASGGGGSAGILICAAITVRGGAGTGRVIWNDIGTNSGYVVRVGAGNVLEIVAGNGTAYTILGTVATLPVGETHVVTGWDDGSNLNVQIDNGAIAQVARPVVSAGTAGFTVGKSNQTASSFFNGDLHQLVYCKNTARTELERAALKTYVGRKVGLSL